jgi:hypothetical protein
LASRGAGAFVREVADDVWVETLRSTSLIVDGGAPILPLDRSVTLLQSVTSLLDARMRVTYRLQHPLKHSWRSRIQ